MITKWNPNWNQNDWFDSRATWLIPGPSNPSNAIKQIIETGNCFSSHSIYLISISFLLDLSNGAPSKWWSPGIITVNTHHWLCSGIRSGMRFENHRLVIPSDCQTHHLLSTPITHPTTVQPTLEVTLDDLLFCDRDTREYDHGWFIKISATCESIWSKRLRFFNETNVRNMLGLFINHHLHWRFWHKSNHSQLIRCPQWVNNRSKFVSMFHFALFFQLFLRVLQLLFEPVFHLHFFRSSDFFFLSFIPRTMQRIDFFYFHFYCDHSRNDTLTHRNIATAKRRKRAVNYHPSRPPKWLNVYLSKTKEEEEE